MEAYVNGVSTRKIERMVIEVGLEGMDKSQVSGINRGLDGRVSAFVERPLNAPYGIFGSIPPFLRCERMAVNADGYREILRIVIGTSETEDFWKVFLRELLNRGLSGVR